MATGLGPDHDVQIQRVDGYRPPRILVGRGHPSWTGTTGNRAPYHCRSALELMFPDLEIDGLPGSTAIWYQALITCPMTEPTPTPSQSLSSVLEKTEHIQDSVEECAAELSFVNSTLKNSLDRRPSQSVIEGALEKSETIETKVQQCADELTHVNQALEEEVHERQLLEHQLGAARE